MRDYSDCLLLSSFEYMHAHLYGINNNIVTI